MEDFEATIKSLNPACIAGAGGVEDNAIGAAVQVFVAEIPDAYLALPSAAVALNVAERGRLDRLRHPRRRAQFVAGRMLLRHAIARTFGPGSGAWQIDTLDAGGVRLSCEAAIAPASISHSGALVACAIASRGRVGVDIERLRPRRTPWHSLAEAVLHPVELAALDALDEHERWPAWYRRWTFKEALSKALGIGLRLGFRQVCFAPQFHSVAIDGTDAALVHDFRFAAVECGAHAVGAVAWSPTSHNDNVRIERSGLS